MGGVGWGMWGGGWGVGVWGGGCGVGGVRCGVGISSVSIPSHSFLAETGVVPELFRKESPSQWVWGLLTEGTVIKGLT